MPFLERDNKDSHGALWNQNKAGNKLRLRVEEGSHANSEKMWRSFSNSTNMYNKSKQTSTNNVLPMEIYIMFGINSNSSSADRREGTNLDALQILPKIVFWF